MTDKVIIFVTAPSRREGKNIARHLVETRLAACVSLLPLIESVYRWEGKVVDENESLLVIKSNRKLFPEIEAEISKIHSYDTPEIICLPVVDGSRKYLQWLSDSLKRVGGSQESKVVRSA